MTSFAAAIKRLLPPAPLPPPAPYQLHWVKSQAETWLDLMDCYLYSIGDASGVYVVWNEGSGRVVYVGRGNVAERLSEHRGSLLIHTHGEQSRLLVTYTVVPPLFQSGVERYLSNVYRPLIGQRFPDVPPIPVTLPEPWYGLFARRGPHIPLPPVPAVSRRVSPLLAALLRPEARRADNWPTRPT